MERRQKNSLLMFETLEDYLKGHSRQLEGTPRLQTGVNSLHSQIVTIKTANEKIENVTIGKTELKRKAQSVMSDMLNPIRNQVLSIAQNTGREDAIAIAGISESAFSALRDGDQLRRAEAILKEARKCLPELAACNITQATLDELDVCIATFRSTLLDRNSSVADRKGSGEELEGLFIQTNLMLKRDLDTVMELFRSSDPEFYKGYKAARHVQELGKRSSKKVAARKAAKKAAAEKEASAAVETSQTSASTPEAAAPPAVDATTKTPQPASAGDGVAQIPAVTAQTSVLDIRKPAASVPVNGASVAV